MDFKLNVNDNGDVEVVMKAGTDYVRTVKPEGECIGLIKAASSVETSDKFDGVGIAVNGGEIYIAGKLLTGKTEKPAAEPKKDEPKAEKAYDKPKQNNFKKYNNNKKKGE